MMQSDDWGNLYGYDGKLYWVEEFVGEKPVHSRVGFRTPRLAVEDFLHQGYTFYVEMVKGVWVLTAYRTFELPSGRVVEIRQVFGPLELYREALAYYGVEPRKIEPEPKTPEDKLKRYASLGCEFQLRKRWSRYYLYARRWNPEKKKREHKYIGPWSQQLKKTAEELGIKITIYEK